MLDAVYTTMDGDTWDILALDFYNNEYKANYIMDRNPNYANMVIFPAGVKLYIPVISAQKAAVSPPPWKQV